MKQNDFVPKIIRTHSALSGVRAFFHIVPDQNMTPNACFPESTSKDSSGKPKYLEEESRMG